MKNQSNSNAPAGWTSAQTYIVAACCLALGICVGYLVPGSSPAQASRAAAASPASSTSAAPGEPTAEEIKHMVDKQVEPMLQQLKSDPNNAELLTGIGNVYYDARQYREAIDYYGRTLKIKPADTSVRTDMGTAYWYLGDPDRAISEFDTVLKAEPTKANALFNLGVVQWEGKMNGEAASAAWQKLLATNPSYENREQVQQMIAQVKQHSGIKPGTKTTKPAY